MCSLEPSSSVSAAVPTAKRGRFPRLGRIVAFFGSLVLLAYAVDAVIDAGLRRITTAKFGSLNQCMTGRVNAEIIVNGSSRAQFHYDPRVLSRVTGRSAYNIGMVAARTDIQLAVLQTYLRHNAAPKVVLQNLEAFSVTATKRGEIYDPTAFQPYLRDNDELYAALRRVEPNAWKWRHIPLYGYAVEDLKFTWIWGLLAWAGKQPAETFHRGFFPRYDEWTDDFERFRAQAGSGLTYEIEPAAVSALTAIIELCRQRGIELILVYSPEYYEAQVLVRNRREIIEAFRRLSQSHGVTFWDYSDSPLSRRTDLFYSSQHLNARGADEFSADLARRLAAVLP